jgi:hypothetical protein
MGLEDLLEHAKRLPAKERRELAQRLLADLDSSSKAAPSEAERMSALDRFLELAGTGHSEFTTVSSDKRKHLSAPVDDE